MDGENSLMSYTVKNRSSPCITWNHIWTPDEMKDALLISPFHNVPNEVLLQLFSLLSIRDLGNISLVCRKFKIIADQDEIWKPKCNQSSKLHSKSYKQIYMEWMYEKYLRNQELESVERKYMEEMQYVACGIRGSPPRYPVRPAGQDYFTPIGGFERHPNESKEMTIDISVDLDRTAHELIELLQKASEFRDQWRQPGVVAQMITRYYRFMQLKASCSQNILLVPTLDIEMIWQTHLLRPEMYRADCLRLFHQVIDHSLVTNEIEQFLKEQAFIDTCRLYEEKYGEQYCPLPLNPLSESSTVKYVHPLFGKLKCLIPIYSYWDRTHFQFISESSVNNQENPFSFTEADVILDGNWLNLCKRFMTEMKLKIPQRHFYSNELAKIDLGKGAMRRLKKSYERFLYMAAKYPPTGNYAFTHPTYAIDIIWHSHMQEPLKYVSDCQRIIGYIIDHAPWPSVDTSSIKKSCENTSSDWKREFKTEMCTDHLYNTVKDEYDQWDD